MHHWTAYEGVRFDELLRASPELYGKVQVIRVDYEAPRLNLDASVDLVLLMREIHMMKNWGTLDAWLREIHRALKPGGVLGVVDHRAAPGANPEDVARTGYLPEAWVIARSRRRALRWPGSPRSTPTRRIRRIIRTESGPFRPSSSAVRATATGTRPSERATG